MDFTPVSNGVDCSAQKYPDVWKSSRFADRHSSEYEDGALKILLKKGDPQLLVGELSLSDNEHEISPSPTHLQGDLQRDEAVDSEMDAQNRDNTTILDDVSVHGSSLDVKPNIASNSIGNLMHAAPTWLSTALRQQLRTPSSDVLTVVDESEGRKWCPSCEATLVDGGDCMCSKMQGMSPASPDAPGLPYTHWLTSVPSSASHRSSSTLTPDKLEHMGEKSVSPMREFSDLAEPGNRDYRNVGLGLRINTDSYNENGMDPNDYQCENMSRLEVHGEKQKYWQEARMKAKIIRHPMYPELVAAHVSCLKIACPVDKLSAIGEQVGQAHKVSEKYSIFTLEELDDGVDDKAELDRFMREYTHLLRCLKEDLQRHVQYHATEAMVGCWEIEQILLGLTGVTPKQGSHNGSTMSDDEEEEEEDSDVTGGYESNYDGGHDTGMYGPLIPSETERSLMERVRQELKLELKQGYKSKIAEVREEILRKRRAGKLPEGTTIVLKAWWNAHSKWPYPTEDEKERLIQETGLELKQVNNWFINQRKRNWHANPLSSSNELKSKRKGM